MNFTKNRWAAFGYLVLVFGSGTLVGAVANRLYMTTAAVAATAPPKSPAQARKDFLDKLRTRVNAGPEQTAQVNVVLNDAKRKYSELDALNKPLREKIDRERVDGILAILKPDQQKLFLTWRAEVKARREAEAKAQKAQAESAAAKQPSAPLTR